ncbi:Hypothetical predicted protein, partial [Pelobates cultripes]
MDSKAQDGGCQTSQTYIMAFPQLLKRKTSSYFSWGATKLCHLKAFFASEIDTLKKDLSSLSGCIQATE